MKSLIFLPILFFGYFSIAQVNIPPIYLQINKAYELEDYHTVIELHGDALAQLQSRQDSLLADTYFLIGDSYMMLGDLLSASNYLEKELDLIKKIGNSETEGYSNTLYNVITIYNELGEYQKANQKATELIALDKARFGKSSEEYIYSIISHSKILTKLEKFDEANKILQQTMRGIKKDHELYPSLLSQQADLLNIVGKYTQAENKFKESLSLIEDLYGPESHAYASTSANLALLYNSQARYPQAEQLLIHALQVLKNDTELDYNEDYISTLNNLALVHLSLNQHEKGLEELKEVLQHDQETYGENHPYLALTLSTMGMAYNMMHEFGKSEEVLNQALSISEKNMGKNSISYAVDANNLGSMYRLSGQPEKAIPLYEESMQVFKEALGKDDPSYINSNYNLGLAYFALENKKAEKLLKSSLSAREKIFGKDHPSYAESAEKLAFWYWFNKETKNTTAYFDEVFENYYQQIESYFPALSEDEKSKFFYNKLKPSFEAFNNYVLENHKENPALLDKMINHQLNTKALIMYATNRVRESITESGDSILEMQYEEWLRLKEQLSRLYSGQKPGAEVQIDSLNQLAESLEKEIGRKSSSFTSTYLKKRVDWKEIQKILNDGEAVIEIIRFKDFEPAAGGKFNDDVHYVALMFTNKDPHPILIEIPEGKMLEERYINNYRNAIKFKIKDEHSYDKLWRPIAEKFNGINEIYFSPDGLYNQLSIFSLYNPQSGNYLVDEIDLRVLTNSRDLLSAGSKKNAKNKTYLFGYPNYNKHLEKSDTSQTRGVLRGDDGGGTTEELTRSLTRGMRSGLLRYMRGDEGITMLPGTKAEIQNIETLFESAEVEREILLNDDANESYIKSIVNPRTLHIATHGFFLPDIETDLRGEVNNFVENPLLRSGLILAGAGDFLISGEPVDSTGQDGILTAYEAMNLNLEDTKLVVLSACETGLGDIKNGEGVYGLQRAFLIAGAENIIMSMWSVDDDATQELMSVFYKEWLKTNDKQMAFRIAQQQIKEKWVDPFYWGAFVMVGI